MSNLRPGAYVKVAPKKTKDRIPWDPVDSVYGVLISMVDEDRKDTFVMPAVYYVVIDPPYKHIEWCAVERVEFVHQCSIEELRTHFDRHVRELANDTNR